MSEISIISARKSRLSLSSKKGSKSAKAALEIANSPNKFLSTVQIGITLIGIMVGIFSGESMTENVRISLESVSWLKPYAGTLALIIVVAFITFLSLVFGELLPKRIGLSNPEGIAKMVARPMNILSMLTLPFVWLLTFTSDLLIRVLAIKPSKDNKITEEEIKAIIREGKKDGEVQEIEQDIMERAFILGDLKVISLMTNRNEIIFININHNIDAIMKIAGNDLHSVYPVYDEHQDNILGVVFLKDLFVYLNKDNFNLKDHLKKVQYISENTSVYKALKLFKNNRINYGIVVDEYGITKGIVTVNDVLESLVGSVSDFYKDEFTLEERKDGTFIIDGQFPFHDFLLHFGLDDISELADFNTISGLLLDLFQKVPNTKDKIMWKNFEFEILDMDNARIDKILLTPKKNIK